MIKTSADSAGFIILIDTLSLIISYTLQCRKSRTSCTALQEFP